MKTFSPNPWRDWQYLLGGFFVILIVVAISYLVVSWSGERRGLPMTGGEGVQTVKLNQSKLEAVLKNVEARANEHQSILSNPKKLKDPSL
jgi:hypothetical protein